MGDTSTGSPRSGDREAGAGRGSRALKGVLFGLIPLALLLLLSELLLRALGLGDPRERLSLTRGFDERARYLVADPAVPGGWVTQMYEGVVPEVHIPPKDGRLRVLLFGGSNTQGFPADDLQAALCSRAPDPGFEVINLGRQGYGSERVAILLDQAMVLQPDIVFLYSGHNEFVERGFAMELVAEWQQPWIVRLVDRLSRLRTLNVLVSALEHRPDAAATTGPPPERRVERGADFRGLSYDKTLQFYEEYRHNLERMISTAQRHGAQVMMSTVVGNMLVPPMVVTDPPELSAATVARLRKLQAEGVNSIPLRLRSGLAQVGKTSTPLRVDPRDWGDTVTAEERERRRSLPDTGFVPPELRALPAPFAQGPYWPEPALWDGEVRELLPTVAAVLARTLSESERADVTAAMATFEKALAISPADAVTLFDLGLCTWLLGGDDARACQLLRDAARYDHAPTRGNDVTNGIVRDLAEQHPDAMFVDAENLVRASCPGGLMTYELLMDNCHFYKPVRVLLMDLFVPGLLELGTRRAAR